MEMLLKKGEVLALGRSMRNGRVRCKTGTCWITCTGQPGDHLLSSDAEFRVSGRGELLVSALSECRVELIPTTNRCTIEPLERLHPLTGS